MTTTLWVTLRADRSKPPFNSGKDAWVLTAIAFDSEKKIAEAVANLAGLDILTTTQKETDQGGGWSTYRQTNRCLLLIGRFPSDIYDARRREWRRFSVYIHSRPG